jgi:hypothetical protein
MTEQQYIDLLAMGMLLEVTLFTGIIVYIFVEVLKWFR